MPTDNEVFALCRGNFRDYPSIFPFSPNQKYPEYPFGDVSRETNEVYDMVRELLFIMGLDISHYGATEWNPLGDFIMPGNTVLIKPNLVRHYHGYEWNINSVIAHGSIIRAILDYVHIALKGQGKIIIGDAPLQQGDFNQLKALNGLDSIETFFRENSRVPLELVDFRTEKAVIMNDRYKIGTEQLSGDPHRYFAVDLGGESLHASGGCKYEKYRVTNYKPHVMKIHHNKNNNEYLISGSSLLSDVIINISKMKTHRKAGITASLKNFVGINGNKDWLPHHTRGALEDGGDEFLYRNHLKSATCTLTEYEELVEAIPMKIMLKNIRRLLYRLSCHFTKDLFYEGSWYGNDTLWRTILDLNRVIMYADKRGSLKGTVQRKFLNIVDGIIAGEGEGPLEPTPKRCGLLVGGKNPVAVDAVVATLMGFDYRKIPSIVNGFKVDKFPLCTFNSGDVEMVSKFDKRGKESLSSIQKNLNFKPSSGWAGNIER
jgi:uncharacterized protein (DUF362 family)